MSGTAGNQGAAAPVPGSDAYNQQMAQAGDNVILNSGNAVPSGDPAKANAGEFDGMNQGGGEKLLAGKFKTVEELEAAFNQLQSGNSGDSNNNQQQSQQNNADLQNAANANAQDAANALQSRGLDFNAFSAEYESNGGLSEASYQKLAEAGIPKEVVDSYIAGQEAQANLMVTEVHQAVGGYDSYAQMIQWAAQNLSHSEIDAYNAVASTGDINVAKLAAEGLYRRYTEAVGTNRPMINGSTSPVSTDVFQSTFQVTEAMRDPRYRNDPAYRRSVAEKIARSSIL